MIAMQTRGPRLYSARVGLMLLAGAVCLATDFTSAAPSLEERAEALQAVREAGGNVRHAPETLPVADLNDVFDPRHQFADVYLQSARSLADLLPRLTALTELERLYLTESDITDADLTQLPKLPNLKVLWLEQTAITDDGLPAIGELSELVTLSLTGANLTGKGLKSLAGLKDLQQLFLDNTSVGDTGLAQLAALRQLTDLSLCETNVGNGGLSQLRDCQGLQTLRLRATLVNDAGMANLAQLPTLSVLDLSDTIVGDAGIEQLGRFDRFSQLGLARSKITDASAERIGQAVKLDILDLTATALTDAGLAKLAGSVDLRVLRLGGTKITDGGLKHLAAMKRLELLDLGGTAISDAGLPEIKQLAALRQLNLSDTSISPDGLAALRDLPRLEHVGVSGTSVTAVDLLRRLPRTTERVRRILAALDELTEIDFTDVPLSDGLEYLSNRHGIPIHVDRRSLEEAGIDLGAAVTANLAGVTLRQALATILDPLGLAIDVRHEVLFIGAAPLSPVLTDLPTVPDGERLAPKLAAALCEDCIIDCTEQPLSKVIGDLSKQHGIAICLDSPRFAHGDLNTDMPVTIRVAQVSLKSALELLLNGVDLSCAANGDTLVVLTKSNAAR